MRLSMSVWRIVYIVVTSYSILYTLCSVQCSNVVVLQVVDMIDLVYTNNHGTLDIYIYNVLSELVYK